MEADGILAMVRWLGLAFGDFAVGSTGMHHVTTPVGSMRRFDTQAFFKAIEEKRVANGLTWKQVAAEIRGFTPGMLTRLATRGRMSADQVVSLSDWLGRAPEEFTYAAKA
jgi:hypothetical protein